MARTTTNPNLTVILDQDLFDRLTTYCKKYSYGKAELIRQLIRDKLFKPEPDKPGTEPQPNSWQPTKPPPLLLKFCTICKLPKDTATLQEVTYTADGDKTTALMCPDCFNTLPDDLKLNYHPLNP